MDKRYQVFVSSTFTDLRDERDSVINCLLKMKCLPASMEMFTATNSTPWEHIKRIIEESDYYIVVIGARYGSLDEDGISYTEKEFGYAEELDIPILGFIHGDPQSIPQGKTEGTVKARRKLDDFRKRVQEKLVDRFTNPHELSTQVMAALYHQFNENPRVGWVRADQAVSSTDSAEYQKARAELAELKLQLAARPSVDTAVFARGQETTTLDYRYGFDELLAGSQPWRQVEVTWDEVFMAIGPKMRSLTPESKLSPGLNFLVLEKMPDNERKQTGIVNDQASVSGTTTERVLTHLDAIGLIAVAEPPRGKTGNHWLITETGKAHLRELLASRASNPPSVDETASHSTPERTPEPEVPEV